MRTQKRIIRLEEAYHRTGYTRASWYRARQRDPDFPRHIKLGPLQVGVLEEDVDRLIERLSRQVRSTNEGSIRPQRIIRLTEACRRTGYTKASWYRAQKLDPDFPRHIKLGPRQVGILEEDVDRLIERLIQQDD